MAARYQHVTDMIRQDIADRVGGLIWTADDTSTGTDKGDEDGGATASGYRPDDRMRLELRLDGL
jgi:hypothetical protein